MPKCKPCDGKGLTPGQALFEATDLCQPCEGTGWVGKRPAPQKIVIDKKESEPIDPQLLKKGKK